MACGAYPIIPRDAIAFTRDATESKITEVNTALHQACTIGTRARRLDCCPASFEAYISEMEKRAQRMMVASDESLKRLLREVARLSLDDEALGKLMPEIKANLQVIEPLDEIPLGEDDLKGTNP